MTGACTCCPKLTGADAPVTVIVPYAATFEKKVNCEPKRGKREIGEKQDSALLLLLKGLKLSSILFNFKFHISG